MLPTAAIAITAAAIGIAIFSVLFIVDSFKDYEHIVLNFLPIFFIIVPENLLPPQVLQHTKMKKIVIIVIILIVIIAVIGFLYRPIITVEGAYVKLGLRNAAGYMTLRNYGLVQDCVIGVEFIQPQGVKAMLHKTEMDKSTGTMKMVHVEKVCIAPFQTFEFKPGGYHIMIMKELSDFNEVKFRLRLESGALIDVTAPVMVK